MGIGDRYGPLASKTGYPVMRVSGRRVPQPWHDPQAFEPFDFDVVFQVIFSLSIQPQEATFSTAWYIARLVDMSVTEEYLFGDTKFYRDPQ